MLVNDEEDLPTGMAGGEGSGASADLADVAGGAPRDAAEEGFERGAADRAASRGDRREQSRFSRVLRDRAILAQQNAELQARLAAVEAQRARDRAEGFGAELARAEREVQTAVEAGDAEAIARANRRVAELAAGRTAASLQAQEAAVVAERAQLARAEAPEPAGPTETTSAWIEANGWYGRDARMTRQAQVLHVEAVEDGLAPDSPAYWRYIERGLEQRYPGKVTPLYARRAAAPARDEGEAGEADPAAAARVPARAVSGAAPVSRSAAGGPAPAAGQTLRLSAEAVSTAKALGLSPQQYAARAAALAKAGRLNAKTITGGA